MTTTPEQLAKWREKFEAPARSLTEFTPELFEREPDCEYTNMYVESEWQGYLRAKQETEQTIKDARKQVLEDVIQCINSERGSSSDNLILAIKELLK